MDPDPVRQDFADKKFNLKERSFADRSRRELPKRLLEQFKKQQTETEKEMAKKTAMRIEQIKAENRLLDLDKLVN